ncbi:E3 ubiquitin-protein ligase ATL4 [Andrographis paniculata]|uniref:E3 ubiquitin-protein ligase ATL4 n=1 Tax=Andrographis paniculata TaxID=175694 RepID=UPI0021E76837|nr:E3 ubiquitin-protein ligase ATL4 [Andrographis paniculata]
MSIPSSITPPVTAVDGGSIFTAQMPPAPSAAAAYASPSSSIIIVIIIIASAVIVSASIYLLIRFLSRRLRGFSASAAADDVILRGGETYDLQNRCESELLDALPLFTFRSVTGNLNGGDCAVCLSKFEPHDQLRLLPLCCHAFHAACIDTWIAANQTCPLCRSAVFPADSDALDKILAADNRGSAGGGGGGANNNRNSGSFRIEIGSISRRRGGGAGGEAAEGERRSYSVGSFDYILDDSGYEVPVGSITAHRREISDSTDKESSIGIPIPEPPGEFLASEVSGGRNWLRDYVDRLASVSISSRAMSFRSSGRFFSGSSRRTEPAADDVEANRAGEEISELFRWLSGI